MSWTKGRCCLLTSKCIHTCTCLPRTNMCTHTHILCQTQNETEELKLRLRGEKTNILAHTCTHTCTHMHTDMYTHMQCTHAHTCALIHAHRHAHTGTHRHTKTQTHMCTYTCKQTYTYTDTETHTRAHGCERKQEPVGQRR